MTPFPDKNVRNPLGVIALFLWLTYAIAALLFGSSASALTEYQRWAFIAFLVAFPLAVLAVFFRLVTTHHQKLYAPSDFRSDEGYWGLQTQAEKVDKLVHDSQAERGEEATVQPLEAEDSTKAHHTVRSDAPSSAEQPTRATESRSTVPPETFEPGARSRLAERRAIEYLERRLGVRLQREIAVREGTRSESFDAGILGEKSAVVVEAKYLRRAFVSLETLKRIHEAMTFARGVLPAWMAMEAHVLFAVDGSDPLEAVVSKASKHLRVPHAGVIVHALRASQLAGGSEGVESVSFALPMTP